MATVTSLSSHLASRAPERGWGDRGANRLSDHPRTPPTTPRASGRTGAAGEPLSEHCHRIRTVRSPAGVLDRPGPAFLSGSSGPGYPAPCSLIHARLRTLSGNLRWLQGSPRRAVALTRTVTLLCQSRSGLSAGDRPSAETPHSVPESATPPRYYSRSSPSVTSPQPASPLRPRLRHPICHF